jgi:Zn-dependent protease/CBS domain-containing protein
MFERGALTLVRIRGVPIRAHWTLLLILPYLAVVLSVQFGTLAGVAGVRGSSLLLPPLAWGAILAIALFLSVALHELAHTALALRFGGKVRAITLMLLGGVSQISRMPDRPRFEAMMAGAGPLASAAIGAALLGVRAAAPWPPDVSMGLFYLGAVNIALAIFNLIPAFPMDGGRVLRAALASRMGTARGTAVAATVGKGFAVLMVVLGLATGNLLLILIALFVYAGASAEARSEKVRAMLSGATIGELVPAIRGAIATVSARATASEALTRMRQLGVPELIVLDDSGAPAAVVRVDDVAALRADRHASTPVGQLIEGRATRHVVVNVDARAEDALDGAVEGNAPYLIVVRPEAAAPARLVGLVSTAEIGTALALRMAERGPAATRRAVPV